VKRLVMQSADCSVALDMVTSMLFFFVEIFVCLVIIQNMVIQLSFYKNWFVVICGVNQNTIVPVYLNEGFCC